MVAANFTSPQPYCLLQTLHLSLLLYQWCTKVCYLLHVFPWTIKRFVVCCLLCFLSIWSFFRIASYSALKRSVVLQLISKLVSVPAYVHFTIWRSLLSDYSIVHVADVPSLFKMIISHCTQTLVMSVLTRYSELLGSACSIALELFSMLFSIQSTLCSTI